MKMGEGAEKKLSSVVTSPWDPLSDELLPGEKSDNRDDLSECLSCSTASEFERHCNENSKIGDENYKVNNIVDWRNLTDFSEPGASTRGGECSYGKDESQPFNIGKGLDLYANDAIVDKSKLQNATGELCDKLFVKRDSFGHAEYKNNDLNVKESESFRVSDGSLDFKPTGTEESSELCRNVETMGGSLERSVHQSALATGGAELVRYSGESETSSKYEHSEGEDSMFEGNTDDEKDFNSYYRREVRYSLEENDKNENKLVMSSAVAFGSDDWDDFMQENGEFTLTSMVHEHEELLPENAPTIESEKGCLNSATTVTPEYLGIDIAVDKKDDLPSNHYQTGDELTNYPTTCFVDPLTLLNLGKSDHMNYESTAFLTNSQIEDIHKAAKPLEQSSIFKVLKQDRNPKVQVEDIPTKEDLKMEGGESEMKHQGACAEEVVPIRENLVSEKLELKQTILLSDPLTYLNPISHRDKEKHYSSTEPLEDVKLEISTDQSSSASSASVANDATNAKRRINNSSHLYGSENYLISTTTQKLELNELYDELVHDMEEILLESGESLGFTLGNKIYQSYIPLPSRDGGSTASTSGTDDAYTVIQHPLRFDRVEVISAKQKKGDVSLSERLVGVREYTVYRIRVWNGKDYWEVEKRYREFYALYRRLKKLFTDQGRILPPVWSSIEQESRKIFGSASADVISERSILIQECLNSLLLPRFPTGAFNAVVCFLYPSKDLPNSPTYDANIPQSPFSLRSTNRGDVSSLGKTISLIVHKRPYKSNKQLLDEQHYSCAGCYKNFDDGRTRIQELVQTLGWGKPRLCEYSGQLYCSSCHTNDMAVLPAKILHFWDFNQYPVSQMSKSYLDSIHDQPMLCVGAVNPFLFSKVPALQHVTDIRKRIGTMLPFVRCPFRRSIYKGVGSRRYLLESNDFFSLRDLIDLSKGVFAALPVMMETISRKILEHIAEQCLICCDRGVPCNARQACDDPSSLIFPFQEGEIDRCKSCKSVFHKHCFRKISICYCGTHFNPEQESNTNRGSQTNSSTGETSLDLSGKREGLNKGLFSGLFSKVRSLKSSDSGEQRPEDKSTVIVMGSLPMTNL